MEKLNQDKKQIREYIKREKTKLTEEQIIEKSRCIIENVIKLPEYKDAECIFTYVNFNEEVITTAFIDESLRRRKHVFVPKVFREKNSFMEFIEIEDLSELEAGYMGVPEPIKGLEAVTKCREGLLIMPGLAFDRQFHRIGYGGGFYDRFLSAPHDFKTVAVAYDFQLMDMIPYERHDLKPQIIITNQEILKNFLRKDGNNDYYRTDG